MKKFWWSIWFLTLATAVVDFIYVIFIRKELFDKTPNIFALIFLISLLLCGFSFLMAILFTFLGIKLKNKRLIRLRKIINVSLVAIGIVIGFILNICVLKSAIAFFKEIKLQRYFQNTTPTITSIPAPTPTISSQGNRQNNYQYIQPTIDLDPIVTCKSDLCDGGRIRQSECSNSTCCAINGKWIFYRDKNKCVTDQNQYNNQSSQQLQNNQNNQLNQEMLKYYQNQNNEKYENCLKETSDRRNNCLSGCKRLYDSGFKLCEAQQNSTDCIKNAGDEWIECDNQCYTSPAYSVSFCSYLK